jgi:hypothetical protein
MTLPVKSNGTTKLILSLVTSLLLLVIGTLFAYRETVWVPKIDDSIKLLSATAAVNRADIDNTKKDVEEIKHMIGVVNASQNIIINNQDKILKAIEQKR